MAQVRGVVMSPPDHFDVVDVKNPFMAGNAGTVDRALALEQWAAMRKTFAAEGARVEIVPALAACEDMVFCANTALLGLSADGHPVCVPAHMTFASRRAEVAPMVIWARSAGYDVIDVADTTLRFEGSGDAIWHPGRRLLWGGFGWRTDPQIYRALAAQLNVPVMSLALTDSTYYHLDTCFCPLDGTSVLVFPSAIAPEGMQLVRAVFENIVEVDAEEAARFACNAAVMPSGAVAIDRRASATAARLRSFGYRTVELDTGEFLKSGGSVYCMKNAFF